MYSRPSAFYPALTGRHELAQSDHDGTYSQRMFDSYHGYNWAATPPYYHGQAWLDVTFTADETRKYKLEEILSGSVAGLDLRFDRSGDAEPANNSGFFNNLTAQAGVPRGLRANIMNLSDVLITDGRARIKSVGI